MCTTPFIASGIGGHATPRSSLSPWVEAGPECIPPSAADRVAGEKPVEGHQAFAGQARMPVRMQMSIHVKVVGLSLVQRGHVPARVLSRTAPGSITCPNAEGTRAGRTDPGRRKRSVANFVREFGHLSIPRIQETVLPAGVLNDHAP